MLFWTDQYHCNVLRIYRIHPSLYTLSNYLKICITLHSIMLMLHTCLIVWLCKLLFKSSTYSTSRFQFLSAICLYTECVIPGITLHLDSEPFSQFTFCSFISRVTNQPALKLSIVNVIRIWAKGSAPLLTSVCPTAGYTWLFFSLVFLCNLWQFHGFSFLFFAICAEWQVVEKWWLPCRTSYLQVGIPLCCDCNTNLIWAISSHSWFSFGMHF